MKNPLRVFTQPKEQSGLASIVIVAVLVVLLSLISIGFARLMDRAVNGSLNNQLSSSATYAAQSAVNDTIAYIQAQANPDTVSSKTCNDAGGASSILDTDGNPNGNNKINPEFSGQSNYKYTCILVDPTPPSLGYTLPSSQSEVTKITTLSSSISSLMFSWQTTASSTDSLSSPCGNGKLLDESAWASNDCPPLLRVSLYPVSGGTVSQPSSRTYFFYPANAGLSTVAYNNAAADGSSISVKCNTTVPGGFNGNDPKLCNATITNLASGDNQYYLRITSLYQPGNVGIEANDSGGALLKFKDTQSLIDVTAQAGTATKRLQARIGNDCTPGEEACVEDGLRSAEAICKQLDVGSSVTISTSFCAKQFTINQPPPPPPPTVNFCVDSGSDCSSGGYTSTSATINDSDQAVLRWHVLNANAGCNSTGSDLPWGSPGGDSTSSAQTDPLSGGAPDGPGSDYTFTLKCSNTAGQSVTQTVTVHAKATTGSGPCSNNCGSPGPGTSCTSAVNVSWDGSENPDGSLSWSAWDDPDCSYGIHYCDAETDATAYGIFDNGNDNPLNTSSGSGYPNDPNVVRIGCEDLAGNWGWSDSYPTGGNPGSPGTNPYWVSKGISYYGVKGGEVSKGISSWCNDSDAGHGYLVCGVYVTGNESYCSLSWRANGSTFQENQYNGVVDTTNSPPSKYNDSGNPSPNPPGFVLGFPNAAYVITDGKAPILDVACNGLSDFVWSPKSYPVGT